MTKQLLIILLPGLLWGETTTVTRMVVTPEGALADGTAYIRITAPCVSGSTHVEALTNTVRFVAGNFSVKLVANDSCVPEGTSYIVRWAIGDSTIDETWVVPTSATPLTVSSVVVDTMPAPAAAALSSLAQLNPFGGAKGSAVCFDGPFGPAGGCGSRAASFFRQASPVAAQTAAAAEEPRPASEDQAQSSSDAPVELSLTVGKSILIDSVPVVERISVGIGDIAEGSAISPHELLLNGKTPGVTSVIVWLVGGGRRFFNVTVAPSSYLADNRVESVQRELERELPGQNVNLSFENETAFLRGTVNDVTSGDRAVSIASTLGKTVNLLYVKVPPPEPQILLRVKFASVDRSISTQLGVNLFSTGAGHTVGGVTTQEYSPPGFPPLQGGTPVAATLSDALNLLFFRSDINLGASIQALEVKGLLQVLAEPNMLAENGKKASFLAGGEFPFPSVSSAAGGTPVVSIQFREFGIRLTFTPTITPRGTIHLEVAPEVSALDFTNGLLVSGFNVPALTTRKLNTQVELSEGQSFAIGGLIDNTTTDTFEKIPFIGDIPILGNLFKSKSVSKQNTELIVIVTPELVHPIPAGQPVPELHYPRQFLEPNTKELWRPAMNATDPANSKPPNETIPIEKLILSLQPPASPATPAVLPAKSPIVPPNN